MDIIERYKQTIVKIDLEIQELKDRLAAGSTINWESASATLASTQGVVSRVKALKDIKDELIKETPLTRFPQEAGRG